MNLKAIAVCAMFVLAPVSLYAQNGQEPQRDGFSGSISLGAGWNYRKPSLDEANDENETINSLDAEAEFSSKAIPFPMADLTYKFPGSETAVSLGRLTVTGAGVTLSQNMGRPGRLEVTVRYDKKDVWKNPYLIGAERDETDQVERSVAAKWDRIAGLPFNVSYSYKEIDVDRDLIGESVKFLRRDGQAQTGGIGIPLYFGRAGNGSFNLMYTNGDIRGASNHYNGYTVELQHRITMVPVMFMRSLFLGPAMVSTSLSATEDRYDKVHPVFDKERRDQRAAARIIIICNGLLGSDNWYANVMISGEKTFSNIDFFDSYGAIGAVGAGFRF